MPNLTEQSEHSAQFEQRKRDHIRLSLDDKNEAIGESGLDRIDLVHEALPDLNFSEIEISHPILGKVRKTPFFVSSMTAGHADAVGLNLRLAKACEGRGWMMGVGSQRRELKDLASAAEWKAVRKEAPSVSLLGNLGLSQLIQSSLDDVRRLVDSLQAEAMFVHTNPLQEVLQSEGTPQFKGWRKSLEALCRNLEVPVILKETGCGFSKETLSSLNNLGLAAVDLSGYGGTHWGRIEGDRLNSLDPRKAAARTFSNWGISTLQSMLNALEVQPKYEIWASGGVRTGRESACLLAMGANNLGIAKPILVAALEGEDKLDQVMDRFEFELKVAMFCTGSAKIENLKTKAWVWRNP